MANLTIRVRDDVFGGRPSPPLDAIEGVLCRTLRLPPSACNVMLVPMRHAGASADVYVELHYRAHASRTPTLIRRLGDEVLDLVRSPSDRKLAFRGFPLRA